MALPHWKRLEKENPEQVKEQQQNEAKDNAQTLRIMRLNERGETQRSESEQLLVFSY